MMWHDGWNDGWGAGGWVMMSLFMLVFWTAVVAGIVWLVRSARPSSPPPTSDSALRILDERFARGEISEEDYRSRRDLLAAR